MKRDEEIKRLVRYANGMGAPVVFKAPIDGSYVGGTWSFVGNQITIYVQKSDSKIAIILRLIHEISHHKAFIKRGRTYKDKVADAYGVTAEAKDISEVPKSALRTIYEFEKGDSKYWEEIYKDTGCSFPIYKLYVEREMDIWVYWYMWKYRKVYSPKEYYKQRKKLLKKYKGVK